MAWSTFALSLLAFAPSWHEHLHHDAHEADHGCAITLFAGGVDAAATPPPAGAPTSFRIEPALRPQPAALPVNDSRLLPPSRAPPACA